MSILFISKRDLIAFFMNYTGGFAYFIKGFFIYISLDFFLFLLILV
jgi:hypothetical protein